MPDWIYDDLREHESSHSEVKKLSVDRFRSLLDTHPDENACQDYLARNPAILAAYGRSGHGECVLAKPRLGSAYVPDFIIGHGSSAGPFWSLVELESPRHRPFNKDGTFSTPLRKAIDQILRWRIWIGQNIDLVQRSKRQQGLGLYGLTGRAHADIIIGRRMEAPSHYEDLRRVESEEHSIRIMSYDRFLDMPMKQALFWDREPIERLQDHFPDITFVEQKRP